MSYTKGQKVRVKNHLGHLVEGVIQGECDFPSLGGDPAYWCQYNNTFDGIQFHIDVDLFYKSSLDTWNIPKIIGKCTCGADAVNSTKHSRNYCDKYDWSTIYD